jgi:hypothetical protein
LIPAWCAHALTFWSLIFADLESSAALAPYRRLIAAVLRSYSSNQTFGTLQQRYHDPPPARQQQPDPTRAPWTA